MKMRNQALTQVVVRNKKKFKTDKEVKASTSLLVKTAVTSKILIRTGLPERWRCVRAQTY